MLTSKTKKALAAGLALTALGAGLMNGSASADPAQYKALIGVGSDTTQDIMNALAGRANNVLYEPLVSSAATGKRQIISFDATKETAGAGTDCIAVKTGAAAFFRPNGSSSGVKALSRAALGQTFGTPACGGLKAVAGLIDFARSSSGPSGSNTDLTYIPFGRDALSFAYYRKNGDPVTSLTKAQLNDLFTSTTGPRVIDGVLIVPCGIQTGSGTFKFWNKALTGSETSANEDTATSFCNGLVPNPLTNGRAQENDGPDLAARGNAVAARTDSVTIGGTVYPYSGAQVVIGFSAANFIARSNGKALPAPGPRVGIGSISNNGSAVNLGSPIQGTVPNLTPNSTFYADSTFGRLVYNVFPTEVLTADGGDDLKSIFVDTDPSATNTATICNSPYTETIASFGFLSVSNCGVTTIKGSYLDGTS